MNKKSNEIKASIDYSLYGLLTATRELCNIIVLEKQKGKSHIDLSKIDYHYDNIINDCSYFLHNMDKISEIGKELNNLLGKLID